VNERPDEPRILLAILPPTQGQRRLALAIVLALLIAFLVMLPFARMEIPAVHSFVPTNQMALLINDLFTSALLFAQFSVARQRAILVLANRLSFHRADHHSTRADLSRRIFDDGPARSGIADLGMALYFLARGLAGGRDHLCLAEGRGPLHQHGP
jgi:hypothetical protein